MIRRVPELYTTTIISKSNVSHPFNTYLSLFLYFEKYKGYPLLRGILLFRKLNPACTEFTV